MTTVPPSFIQEALEFSRDLMADIDDLVRSRLDAHFAIRRKADGSLVTDIDLFVEREIRGRIGARWPHHSIEGEEDGVDARSGDYRWLIDPIDGTMSLRHGVPLFGTILALTLQGRSIVGVINLPGLCRCYSAGGGLGTYLNGRRLQTGDVAREAIADEIIAVGDYRQFERAGRSAGFETLMKTHPWVRTYADCFGHCLAVEGAVAAMIDPALNPWDFGATDVLIEEAGGRFERRPSSHSGRFDIVCGKPTAVAWILEHDPQILSS